MDPAENAPASEPFAVVVRSVYLGRRTGCVEVELGEEPIRLFFRDGELHLDRDESTALQISPLLAAADRERPAADPELSHAVEALARDLCPEPEVQARFREDQSIVVELVGPLPTVRFVQELAVHGCDEEQLVGRLGGNALKLRSSARTPALDQLPGLEPDMAKVLATLAQPAAPADLLRGAGNERLPLLRGLTKLWAVGLVTPVVGVDATILDWGNEILSPRLLKQFTQRIAESLEAQHLDLEHETHRARLAELLSGLGKMNFYQLLGIDPRAQDEEIFAAYSELARVVHPSHTVELGLGGKEEGVRVLFEKATEAYLTLSDPRRRASYNTVAGIHVQVAVDQQQRDEEKRVIALQNYRRAASCLSQMDFSLAVDLLKEATRMDPKPEYFARLGLAQSKNPKWHRHAVEAYRQAVELDPDNAGNRAAFGGLLEEMNQTDEAREQYQAAVELMPGQVDALAGLDRVGTGLSGFGAKSGGFRNLFNRGDSSD
ncbi:MAG: DnaJ domain-containing protein [bacterium]|nr:DnaJ domain-containing protein [bacterium]